MDYLFDGGVKCVISWPVSTISLSVVFVLRRYLTLFSTTLLHRPFDAFETSTPRKCGPWSHRQQHNWWKRIASTKRPFHVFNLYCTPIWNPKGINYIYGSNKLETCDCLSTYGRSAHFPRLLATSSLKEATCAQGDTYCSLTARESDHEQGG